MVDSYTGYGASGNNEWEDIGQGQGYQDNTGLDENNLVYEVEPLQFELVDNKAQFRFRLRAPHDITFEIQDRYSGLRTYQEQIRKELSGYVFLKNLPAFPPRTFLPDKSEKFLQSRFEALSNFLSQILQLNQVARSETTFKYLELHCADENSSGRLKRIRMLIEHQKQWMQSRGTAASSASMYK